MILSLILLSLKSYAETDLNKYNYCVTERDQAEKTLEICNSSLSSCQEVNELLHTQITKQNDIIYSQATEIVTVDQKNAELEKSSTTNKIVFITLGIVVGLVLHIPLALLIK